jgi:hypothetical protein
MTTMSNNVTTKLKPRLDFDPRSYVTDNYQKPRKNNEHFEKRLLYLISNPHRAMLNEIDSIANNISL